MTGLDWPGLMHVGLRQLRLTPAAFWALTPAELQVMLGALRGAAPMGRRQLADLLRDFPDELKETTDG